MKPAYDDIRARIVELPTWWDIHGVPRYGEVPADLAPFMGRIRCQACLAEFLVCLVGEIYLALYDELVVLIPDAPCPADGSQMHVRYENGAMTEWDHDAGRRLPKPLPADWYYGDPPRHDCVGDTESSIPEWEWADA